MAGLGIKAGANVPGLPVLDAQAHFLRHHAILFKHYSGASVHELRIFLIIKMQVAKPEPGAKRAVIVMPCHGIFRDVGERVFERI